GCSKQYERANWKRDVGATEFRRDVGATEFRRIVNTYLTPERRQDSLDDMHADPPLERLIDSVGAGAPLDRLGAASGLAQGLRTRADELLDHFVEAARAAGCSWTEIGCSLGVSKQA